MNSAVRAALKAPGAIRAFRVALAVSIPAQRLPAPVRTALNDLALACLRADAVSMGNLYADDVFPVLWRARDAAFAHLLAAVETAVADGADDEPTTTEGIPA